MEFAARDTLAGQLLRDLERRQDEALAELDRLSAAVEEVLRAWGGRPVEIEPAADPIGSPDADVETAPRRAAA
jgi:hypothetical protein